METVTSAKEPSHGIVNDQYFYVDKGGNRTPIDQYCTHGDVSGSSTGVSGWEISYSLT
ncbi:DUF6843 domain-containing protein [Metabacillus halosaccharovorans]|uniref:DUF6843 domain-containing protein n=1 Tax=Metabacillus halosaccharovorans TaxID=930124 RepID=UPI00355688A6